MNKIYNLSNRVALITGAGGFLGLFHAMALLENGATVIITDKNISKLNKRASQLRFRLGEGSGKALYMIGVTDSGRTDGIDMKTIYTSIHYL